MKEESKLKGAQYAFEDFKIVNIGIHRFDMSLSFDSKTVEHDLSSMTLELITAWGSDRYTIDNDELGADFILNPRQIIYGSLDLRLFTTAFVHSILTESNTLNAPLKSILLDIDDAVASIRAKRDGPQFSDGFRAVHHNECKDAVAESQNRAIQEATIMGGYVCDLLSSGIVLRPRRKMWQNVSLGLGITRLVGGLLVVGFLAGPAAGAIAAAIHSTVTLSPGIAASIIAVSVVPIITATAISQYKNRENVKQEYREILRLLAANIGRNGNAVSDNEYRLEELIVEGIKSIYKSELEDALRALKDVADLASFRGGRQAKSSHDFSAEDKLSAQSDTDHCLVSLFSRPHRSATVLFKDMTRESQVVAARRLYLVVETHRLRKALEGSTIISIMGPHNVGKSHLLNALFGARLAVTGTHMAQRSAALSVHKLCEKVFVMDTPGITDPRSESRDLACSGLRAAIVLLLFRARDVSDPAIRLFKDVEKRNKRGTVKQVYITHMDTEMDLTAAGIEEHRKDYMERLECSADDFKLVSFRNNAGTEGRSCPNRVLLLQELGVLSAVDVVADVLPVMKRSGHLDINSEKDATSTLSQRIAELNEFDH